MAEYEQIFKALADRTRIRLMRLLAVTDQQVCVCELMDARSERKGTWIYYSSQTEGAVFKQQLADLLKDQLKEKIFSQDEKKLRKRLNLRQGEWCVNGRNESKYKVKP